MAFTAHASDELLPNHIGTHANPASSPPKMKSLNVRDGGQRRTERGVEVLHANVGQPARTSSESDALSKAPLYGPPPLASGSMLMRTAAPQYLYVAPTVYTLRLKLLAAMLESSSVCRKSNVAETFRRSA